MSPDSPVDTGSAGVTSSPVQMRTRKRQERTERGDALPLPAGWKEGLLLLPGEAAWPGGGRRGPRAPGTPPLTPYLVAAPEATVALAGRSLLRCAVLLCHLRGNPCGFDQSKWSPGAPGGETQVPGVEDKLQNLAASEMWSLLTTNLQSFSKHPPSIYCGPEGLGQSGEADTTLQAEIPRPREARLGWGSKARALPLPRSFGGHDTCRLCSGVGRGPRGASSTRIAPTSVPPGSRLPLSSFICQRFQENRVGPLPWAG